jgi:hypothetical protein
MRQAVAGALVLKLVENLRVLTPAVAAATDAASVPGWEGEKNKDEL